MIKQIWNPKTQSWQPKKNMDRLNMDRLDMLHEMSEEAGRGIPGNTHIRTFETGATRNLNDDKLRYEGFLSPIVLKRFAEYMHLHRKQADGKVRDPDNWQKGIPKDAYVDSLVRHVMDLWLHQRGYGERAVEDLETALCAIMFNAMGYLFEVLKKPEQTLEVTGIFGNAGGSNSGNDQAR